MMVSILSHIVEFRNGESGMHVVNIGKITEILLRQINKHTAQYNLSYRMRELIVRASALHDIGKIAIDEKILNKPGKLTDEEFEIMKQHTVIGYKMLSELASVDSEEPLIAVSREIVRWHHERYDGRGYPDGLKGEESPISAQVVALADVYDALTSERVYKPAFSHEKAVRMITNGECGAFNPLLLECLLEAQDDIVQEMNAAEEPFDSYKELKSIVPAIQNNDSLDVTEYMLEQLENERQKNRFTTEISRNLQFDYNRALDLLTIPSWAAKRFGLPTQISDPSHNEKVLEALGPYTVHLLQNAVRASTPQDPLIRLDCKMTYQHVEYDCILIAKILWHLEEDPKIAGYVGKIIQMQDNTDWLESPFELSNHSLTYIHDVTPAELRRK
jgi:putative two-component system response regulator